MKLYERFLTSFEMTINLTTNKENVITCHSERSEESIFLQDNNYRKFYMNILNENT